MNDSKLDPGWNYSLVATSEDKRASRPAVEAPFSHELIGVDGSLDGGLRPFPGFRIIHELEWGLWGGNHDTTSTIVDLFVRNLIIGEDGYGFGFVYRVRRKNAATGATACDVFADFFNSKLTPPRWVRGQVVMEGVPLPPELDRTHGRQMSVTTWGRYIYVFVEDSEPVAISFDRKTPFGFVVLTDTGPGAQPSLESAEDAGPLGSITALEQSRPGVGQIFLSEYLPSGIGLGLGNGTDTSDSGTFYGQPNKDVASLDPGDYAFAYVLYNSQSGRRSALSEVAQVRKADFDPDDSSGGEGPLDPVPLHAFIEIVYDKTRYDQAYVYRSVRTQSAGGTYIAANLHLDRIIDLEDYHSNNNPLPDPDQAQAIYAYELEDKQLVFQDVFTDRVSFDENMPLAGASLWYENTMLCSSIRTPSASSSMKNRPEDSIRGIGEVRWSSLVDISPELFPPQNRYIPNVPSNDVNVLRQVGPNVIGFSSDRQYLIRKESVYLKITEMHEGFGVVNHRACDSAGSLLYFVSPKGVKAVDSQGQLDDVRSLNQVILETWGSSLDHVSLAFDPSLSAVFIHNNILSQTCVLWFNTAKVTEIHDVPFQEVTRGVWPRDFVYNREDLILNDGRNNATYLNVLTERAIFVQNPSKNSSTDAVSPYFFQIYVVDNLRQRTQPIGRFTGSPRRTLLEPSGDSVFTVASPFPSGDDLVVSTLTENLSEDIWGCELYVLHAADPSLIGRHATVRNRPASGTIRLLTADAPQLHGLVAGDVVGLSPVYVRWVGHPAPVVDPSEPVFSNAPDFFRIRHFNSLSASFSDVVNERSANGVAVRYRAAAYKGASPIPAATGIPIDPANPTTPMTSVVDGESRIPAALGSITSDGRNGVAGSCISPGIEIWHPEVDFRILGSMISGSMRATVRTQRG